MARTKKGSLKPLPDFPKLPIDRLKEFPISIIIDFGKNWFTKQYEVRLNKWEYAEVPTHALAHIVNGSCMNVGFTAFFQHINDIFKESHKYIVIVLKDLTDEQILDGISTAQKMVGSPANKFKRYDVWGFIAFGLRKIGFKKIKGSEKYPFCSDSCIDLLQAIQYKFAMSRDSEKISPADLYKLFKLNPYAQYYELST
jgi:hypothetical protein